MKEIRIFNAYINNLKNLNVNIPKDKFVVVIGISGSGKSSFVFDILANEGQNFYLQALGTEFNIDKKGFDKITGISAVISVDQRVLRFSNTRSTVGTWTKLNHLIQLLVSKEGVRVCQKCQNLVRIGFLCEKCNMLQPFVSYKELSFNSIRGICQNCSGRGYIYSADLNKLIPDKKKSIGDICTRYLSPVADELHVFISQYNLSDQTRFDQLNKLEAYNFIHGFKDESGEEFKGILKCVEEYQEIIHYNPTYEFHMKKLGKKEICPECRGSKINKEYLDITINEKNIGDLENMSVAELKSFLSDYVKKGDISDDGKRIISNINRYYDYFESVGLSYLSANRTMPTLSGGETQRLFLMKHINSKMDSIIYIFDEPTSGMHEDEKELLIKRLKDLRDRGNSIIVVEHDKKVIKNADYILEFGPYAGNNGGELIFSGSYKELLKSKKSIFNTYKLTKSNNTIIDNMFEEKLSINNVWTNNLKGISVDIPLGVLVGVSGVSGSGKSSLITETLVRLLNDKLKNNDHDDEQIESGKISNYVDLKNAYILGEKSLNGFALVSQDPIGRSMHSIIATYINIWDKVRKIYSELEEAKRNGFSLADFSFNANGACDSCNGRGIQSIYLGDKKFIYECEICNGKRFKDEVLEIRYKHKNVYDILCMSVTEATGFFKEEDSIYNILNNLVRLGMGYIKLGQSTPTLSGGEAQRIKLAKELGKRKKEKTLYILDEPTTGLSLYDTQNLMKIVRQLIINGNSVIICEHDIDVLSSCDWIIELGPEGGHKGGYIIAEGEPSAIKENRSSNIGKYLI